LKNIELTEQHISTANNHSIAIARLNGDAELDKSDLVFFSDSLAVNWNQNAVKKDSIYHARAIELMRACKREGMTRTEFRSMVDRFIAGQEFTNWSQANVLKYREKAEIHNEDWFQKQLMTTEMRPEHFECFLVEGKKYYCYKADADKVKLSDRVQLFRPKRIERKIGHVENEERTDTDKRISELFQENLELKAENAKLEQRIKQLLLKQQ